MCELGVGPVHLEEIGLPRWELRNANWALYNRTRSVRLEGINQNRDDSVDSFNAKVVEIMHTTAEEVSGKGSGLNQHKVVPLWSDE